MSYVFLSLTGGKLYLSKPNSYNTTSLILVLYDIYDHFMGEEPVGIAFMLPSTQSRLSFVLHFSTLIDLPLRKYDLFTF